MKKIKLITLLLTFIAVSGCQTTFSATSSPGADSNMVKTQ